ncbi:MAG: hypothetical protein OEV92_10160 [Nitrospinota bacterium]|nr:hypothetical protein [Nitrospinota bacterium]
MKNSPEARDKFVEEFKKVDIESEKNKREMKGMMALSQLFFGRDLGYAFPEPLTKKWRTLNAEIEMRTGSTFGCVTEPLGDGGQPVELPEDLAEKCKEKMDAMKWSFFSWWTMLKIAVSGSQPEQGAFNMEVFPMSDDEPYSAMAGFGQPDSCRAKYSVDLCLNYVGYKFFYCFRESDIELVSVLKEDSEGNFNKTYPAHPTALQ